MAKSKKHPTTCPCCNTQRTRKEVRTAAKQVETLDRTLYSYYSDLNIAPYNNLAFEDLRWACDNCLESGKAVTANPEAQVYSYQPHFAYWSTEHSCRNCDCNFLFQVTEQRYWYESLKFNLNSVPVNCPECRKTVRHHKILNQELSDLLRSGEKVLKKEQLIRIVEIYELWGKQEKAKYFSGILKRKNK